MSQLAKTSRPLTIVSGGQTGVDRAALDVARQLGLPRGGWCPLGRRAEDGPIDKSYPLREVESEKYWVRTEQNVIDSDATLILFASHLSGGTEFTHRMVRKHQRPVFSVDLAAKSHPSPAEFEAWIRDNDVQVLNVAGPRESSCPGIYRRASKLLTKLLHSMAAFDRTSS